MEDQDFEQWVDKERGEVETYLLNEGIENPKVGPWPAWDMAPHFAIWSVESQTRPGKIGWWAFSGDCPIDYVSEDGKCHPRNALGILVGNWENYVKHMEAGRQPPDTSFGKSHDLKFLGDLLSTRIGVLKRWLEADSLWEDR